MKKRISMTWISGWAVVFLATSAPAGVAQHDMNGPTTSPKDAEVSAPAVPPAPTLVIPVTTGPPDVRSAASPLDKTSPPGGAEPPKVQLSAWTLEVVKLAHAGLGRNVLLTYIDNTPGTFNLGADQIIYLNDQGVSGDAIAEMLQHDADVLSGLRPVTASTVPLSESGLHITFVRGSDASAKASGKVAISPVPAVGAVQAPTETTGLDFLPPAGPAAGAAESPVWQYPATDELGSVQPATLTQLKQDQDRAATYPIREPYPVAITAPIIVIKAAGLTPNTVVIDFSP